MKRGRSLKSRQRRAFARGRAVAQSGQARRGRLLKKDAALTIGELMVSV